MEIPLIENLKSLIKSGKLIKTSNFGWRTNPITGQREFHNGVDLAPKDGKPFWIYVGNPQLVGDISNSVCGRGMGTIWNGYRTEIGICHLSDWKYEGGYWIFPGKTGAATGIHLHISVKHEGELVDAWDFIHNYRTKPVPLKMAALGLMGLGLILYIQKKA